MIDDQDAYNIGAIRELLLAAFTAETLQRFCLDHLLFQPVVAEFGSGQGLDDRVDRLIDYSRTQLLWDELLAEVREVSPRQYARFESRLLGQPSAGRPLPPLSADLRPASPVDRLIVPVGSPRPAEYICYLSADRLASLFAQVDAQTLADPRYLHHGAALVALGDASEPAETERRRRAAVSQLAVVLDYLERTARIGDLAAIARTRGRLDCDWYSVETGFRAGPWEPANPVVTLSGCIEDYRLLLSCSKPDFTGLHREGEIYIPTSTLGFLFDGEAELLLHGLVRLAAVDRREKVLRGTALYLLLSSDLGALGC